MTVTDSWDMPLRTRLLVRAISRQRGAIRNLSPAQIQRRRAWFAPARRPFTWVTGPVPSSVTIGGTEFTARDGATIPVRTYRPEQAGDQALPGLLWFHGGGWVLGNPRGYDPICAWLAARCQVTVLNVDYRLAPEFRAPRAAHDCIDAARWAATAASELGLRPGALGVAGDSAGGNLAAVVANVIHEEGGAEIAYQALLYPAVDATMSSPSVAEHAEAPVLTRRDMEAFLGLYLGDGPDAVSPLDPIISPLYAAGLAGLPPALVQTADLDPLRDEGSAYAEAMREKGVEVQLTNYTRVPHGFMSFPGATRVGRAARRELADWISRHARPEQVR